jgi:radical SAM protein with 4Fe4S-binding SPASM domain
MNSNLTLLDEGMARFIRQNHIEVGTSLDGDGPAHDASRFDANGAGTYRLVLRAIELLLDVGCQPPGVNLTVTERNFEGLGAEAVRAFANQGLTELAVDIDQIHMLSRSTEALVDKILDLRDAGDDVGIPVAGIWRTAFQNLFADGGSADEQPVSFCRPSRGESLAIAPNGDVLMCPHSRDPVGHVSSLSDVFREDGVLARRVSQNLRGQRVACRGCEIEGLCMGQCMVTNDCSDPRKIEQMCAFYRTVTRCLTAEKINAEMHDALVTV